GVHPDELRRAGRGAGGADPAAAGQPAGEHLLGAETCHKGLFVIGDCSGVTHSLSHASASGVYVAREIAAEEAGRA
ncbi:MAG: hypothetical protein ILO68_00470, partial [Clostridia bacterium]|nr:hypothetical protein [Clostridia bacterium]